MLLDAWEVSKEVSERGCDAILQHCRGGLGLNDENLVLMKLVPLLEGETPGNHLACVVNDGGQESSSYCGASP